MVLCLLYEHAKLETLITGLILYQLQPRNNVVEGLNHEKNHIIKDIICSWE